MLLRPCGAARRGAILQRAEPGAGIRGRIPLLVRDGPIKCVFRETVHLTEAECDRGSRRMTHSLSSESPWRALARLLDSLIRSRSFAFQVKNARFSFDFVNFMKIYASRAPFSLVYFRWRIVSSSRRRRCPCVRWGEPANHEARLEICPGILIIPIGYPVWIRYNVIGS